MYEYIKNYSIVIEDCFTLLTPNELSSNTSKAKALRRPPKSNAILPPLPLKFT